MTWGISPVTQEVLDILADMYHYKTKPPGYEAISTSSRLGWEL